MVKNSRAEKTQSLGDMVGAFQSITTFQYIRDKLSQQRIENYIQNNPKSWTDNIFY
jgi:hypothetical protein